LNAINKSKEELTWIRKQE